MPSRSLPLQRNISLTMVSPMTRRRTHRASSSSSTPRLRPLAATPPHHPTTTSFNSIIAWTHHYENDTQPTTDLFRPATESRHRRPSPGGLVLTTVLTAPTAPSKTTPTLSAHFSTLHFSLNFHLYNLQHYSLLTTIYYLSRFDSNLALTGSVRIKSHRAAPSPPPPTPRKINRQIN